MLSLEQSKFHMARPAGDPRSVRGDTLNVVVFGQTGAAKSSLINMLADREVASVSNNLGGHTTSVQGFKVSRGGRTYKLWDTPGLNSGEKGNVPTREAMDHLYKLVKNVGRISLVIYCVHGSRLTEIVRVNYDLFWRIVCKEKVPIVLVVTGLEQERDMNAWWDANRKGIKRMEMTFDGHACVTTTKGKNDIYKAQYWESEKTVWKLVEDLCRSAPWKVKPEQLEEVGRQMNAYMSDYTKKHWKSWGLARLFRGRGRAWFVAKSWKTVFEASVQGHIGSITNAEVVNGFQVQNNVYLQFSGGDTIGFADSGAPDHELEEDILPVLHAVAKCLQDRGARRKARATAAKHLPEGPRCERAHSMP